MAELIQQSLISIIIPCYNHGKYLATAIESILLQAYKHYEIIIVDDGSTDDTKAISQTYTDIKYVYQPNRGLSAARNKGIEKSKGDYILFLDADDWLFPDALSTNLSYLQKNPTAAFVAGAHEILYEYKNEKQIVQMDTGEKPYHQLLEKNYIAMIAAVLFQRWVLELYKFDVTLKSCEDYDLYLRIAKEYPVISHPKIIATYRIHNDNMSGNYAVMLDSVLSVLKRQEKLSLNKTEKLWYEKGLTFSKSGYSRIIYNNLCSLLKEGKKMDKKELQSLKSHNKPLYAKFLVKRLFQFLHIDISRLIKPTGRKTGVNMGDLNRMTPLSDQFGFDRGGPVDRYYIENFLEKNKPAIKGRVLEVGDNEYTLRFGGSGVTESDILYIDNSNPKATFVGDLSNAPQLPSDSFDCIILTQTLHLIYDYKSAIGTCYRILKPGGVLLLTVPGISPIGHDQWGKLWLWSFTDNSIQKILAEHFSAGGINTATFGNVLVATAFLYGMGVPEISKAQLDTHEHNYQVIIAACAIK